MNIECGDDGLKIGTGGDGQHLGILSPMALEAKPSGLAAKCYRVPVEPPDITGSRAPRKAHDAPRAPRSISRY